MTSHGKKCTIKCVRSELMSRYVKPSESPSSEFFIRIAVADQTAMLLLFLSLSCDLLRQNILFLFTWTFLQKSDFTLACEYIASNMVPV